ncbi:MAG: hypothetical protein KGJ13_10010, partial [Patescibacteria group bacterium]|nr:hypothetical protein [Patescibacteria group bacterium]
PGNQENCIMTTHSSNSGHRSTRGDSLKGIANRARRWYWPLLCLIGIHGKAKVDINIIAVRYESHAIDYVHSYVCERCGRNVPEPEEDY